MANLKRIPKGKIQLYAYVKKENKALIRNKAKEYGLSESKLLDLILDKARTNKLELTSTVKL